MATGRLTDASITAVREAARIDKVVADYVMLKKAGVGSMKGLCPFHDEKGASFHVTPDRNQWHCFGCQEGGDVIAFLQKIENLDFIETIERLADRFGVTLNYEEFVGAAPRTNEDRTATRANRSRLQAANLAAAEFYIAQLFTPEAVEARRFLSERGFDRTTVAPFQVGYSPNGWDVLIKHLTGAGFSAEEIADAGLSSETSNKRAIDRFRGRLMFPIRDQSGDIIGFGARKLLGDDEDKGPKYLNTPETALYKKSRVLYGLDMARKHISKTRRTVVVEGYTDVMACHLSGEETAVATCGTSFGEDHIRIIRRLLGDDGNGGEVIYTFDGDSAGQKAALRAFTMDDHFQTRTSVAVEPSGMDPCEVRMKHGDVGVRDLLDNRVPLFEFAIKTALSQFDLASPEGRANALAGTVPIVAHLRHVEMREGYLRQLARWTGTDLDRVREAARVSANRPVEASTTPTLTPTNQPHDDSTAEEFEVADVDPFERPSSTGDRNTRIVLEVLIQSRKFVQLAQSELNRGDFLHPTYRAVWDAVLVAGADESTADLDPSGWVQAVRAHAPSPTVASVVTELAVDPIKVRIDPSHDAVTKIYLQLVDEACTARRFHLERHIANPDLTPEQLGETLDRITKVLHRHDAAAARLKEMDGSNF